MVKKLSKSFYLAFISVTAGIGYIFLIVAHLLNWWHYINIMSGGIITFSEIGLPELVLALNFGILSWIVMLVLTYKMWFALQDGHARTTPAKAIGFLFIPFFNFYWSFQIYWGFAKDYNAYIQRHNINTKSLPESLFILYLILILFMGLPFLGIIAIVFHYFVWLVIVSKICDAINAL